MLTKTKKIIFSGLLSVSLATSNFSYANAIENSVSAGEEIPTDYLKIVYDGKVIFHELIPKNMIVEVYNRAGEVIKSDVFRNETELILEDPELEIGEYLSYWSLEPSGSKFRILPYVEKIKQYEINLTVDDGGYLLKENSQIMSLVTSVNKDVKLKDILPETKAKEYKKFKGWYEKTLDKDKKEILTKVENLDQKITDNKSYIAQFYDDYNDNEIDDKTEPITISFVTDTKEKMKDVKKYVGETFNPEKPTKKGYIFLGWYTDKEYKKAFDPEIKLTSDLTLYAQFKKSDEIINGSENEPIRDENVSDQVENEIKNPIVSSDNETNKKPSKNEDKKPSKNEDKKPSKNEDKKPSKNEDEKSNAANNKSVATNSQNATNDKSVANNQNIATDNIDSNVGLNDEVKRVYENPNVREKYFVKFLDENGSFIFSMVLPYGRTIQLLDENGTMKKEYSVRQDTTIRIDTKDYVVNKDSIFLDLQSKNKEVNTSRITEITPQVVQQEQGNLGYEKEEKNTSFLQDNALFIALGCFVLACLIGIFLIIKNRRKKAITDNNEQIKLS